MLSSKFDNITMLTLTERPERREFVIGQLQMLDLCKPDKLNLHLAVKHPFGNPISKLFGMTKEHEYSCAREHYTIIKRAYLTGVERLLVLEDDLCLFKSKNEWEQCINDIPDDFDIVSFNAFTTDPQLWDTIASLDESDNGRWSKRDNRVSFWNAAMTGYSRRGMEYYLACQEKRFSVADMPIYIAGLNNELITSYIAKSPMAIQENKNVLPSDIRDSTNDMIDYENDNVYEKYIDKDNYFSYEEINKTDRN